MNFSFSKIIFLEGFMQLTVVSSINTWYNEVVCIKRFEELHWNTLHYIYTHIYQPQRQIFAAIVATTPSLSTSSSDKETSSFSLSSSSSSSSSKLWTKYTLVQDQLAAAVGCLLGLHSRELSEGFILAVLVKCFC